MIAWPLIFLHSHVLLAFVFFSKPSCTWYQCFPLWKTSSCFCSHELCVHSCGIEAFYMIPEWWSNWHIFSIDNSIWIFVLRTWNIASRILILSLVIILTIGFAITSLMPIICTWKTITQKHISVLDEMDFLDDVDILKTFFLGGGSVLCWSLLLA